MLVAIEGIDGAGKGTQAKKLLDRARKEGYTAKLLSFPRYQVTQSSKWIAEYLRGDYGTLQEVHPLFAGTLFALDRFESCEEIKGLLSSCDLVITDRYVASNLAYQSARCREGGDDPMKFVDQLRSLEYDIYGLPEPNLTLFLDMPVAFSEHLIIERGARGYTADDEIVMEILEEMGKPTKGYDIHEENTEYLHAVHEMYYQLIKPPYMDPCEVINCQNENGVLRSKDDIAREVWSAVQAKLQ